MQDKGANESSGGKPFSANVGVVFFLAWLFFLGFVTRVIFAPLMPTIEADLGIGHSQAGSLFLMMSLGYMLVPVCSGLISSKLNHSGTLKASAWMVGLVLLPFGFVENIWAIRLLLIMIGVATGVHLPSAIATITAEIQEADWGKALSVHQAAPPLSFVLAPLFGAMLLQWFSWRYVIVAWAGVALLSALLYHLYGKGGDFPGQLSSPRNIKIITRKPSFWIMVILFAMAMGGNAGIYTMLPLFFVNERGMDLSLANTLIGLSQLSGVAMVFAAGWVTDKVGQKPVMFAALLAAAVATVLLGIAEGRLLMVVLFIQPALVCSFFPAAFAAMSSIAPPHLRCVINALGPPIAFLIGGGILPALVGYMGENYTFSKGIIISGCFMMIGPGLVLFLKLGQYGNMAKR